MLRPLCEFNRSTNCRFIHAVSCNVWRHFCQIIFLNWQSPHPECSLALFGPTRKRKINFHRVPNWSWRRSSPSLTMTCARRSDKVRIYRWRRQLLLPLKPSWQTCWQFFAAEGWWALAIYIGFFLMIFWTYSKNKTHRNDKTRLHLHPCKPFSIGRQCFSLKKPGLQHAGEILVATAAERGLNLQEYTVTSGPLRPKHPKYV